MGLFSRRKTVFVDSDILVIGGGMAGCGATYESRYWGRDLKVVCVEKANIERSGAVRSALKCGPGRSIPIWPPIGPAWPFADLGTKISQYFQFLIRRSSVKACGRRNGRALIPAPGVPILIGMRPAARSSGAGWAGN